MDLEKYLKDNFVTVEKLTNGNYYVKAKNGTEMYIPKNLSSSTKIHAYLPGTGSKGAGKRGADYYNSVAQRLRDNNEGDNPPNYVTVISPEYQDKNHVVNEATKLIKDNGSSVSGLVVEGFSGGAPTALQTANDFVKANPELADKTVVVFSDGWTTRLKQYDLSVLRDKGVKVVAITGIRSNVDRSNTSVNKNGEGDKLRTIVSDLAKSGINVVGVRLKESLHSGVNANVLYNEYSRYLLGESDAIGEDLVTKIKFIENGQGTYDCFVYNSETGQLDKIDGLEGYRIDVNSTEILSYPNVEELNVSNLTKAGAFDIKEETSSVVTTYKALTELQPVSIKVPSSYANTDGIVSDMNFIVSSMNQIRSGISSSEFLTGLKSQTCRNGSGIPGIIMSQVNRYFNAVGDVLTSLAAETKSVTSIAQAWLEFDEAMAKAAEGLGTVGSIVPVEETPPAGDTPETPKDPSPKGPSTPKDPKPKTPTTPTTPTTPETPVTPETPETPVTPETPTEPKHTIVIEDNKITQKLDDGSILEVDYKDGKVISISIKYEYESEAKAQEALEGLVKKYNGKSYINEIKVDKKSVEVKFDEKVLENVDVTKLKEKIKENNEKSDLKLIDLLETQLKGEK